MYEKVWKSLEIEAIFPKTEVNNEWKISFLWNTPPSIQHICETIKFAAPRCTYLGAIRHVGVSTSLWIYIYIYIYTYGCSIYVYTSKDELI